MMVDYPGALKKRFSESLMASGVPPGRLVQYEKWLRHYLYFCTKYRRGELGAVSLNPFFLKLQEQRHSLEQQEQARRALHLFFQLQEAEGSVPLPKISPAIDQGQFSGQTDQIITSKLHCQETVETPPRPPASSPSAPNKPSPAGGRQSSRTAPTPQDPAGEGATAHSADRAVVSDPGRASGPDTSWRDEYRRLSDEIQRRHYSPRTLKTYRHYVGKFQAFTRSIDPGSLTAGQVREFLTHLALQEQVSATTQNLAFNSLLFFFRSVLGKDFGKREGVVRARRAAPVPLVVSREEIDRIVLHLAPPYDLIVKMLYGCGLRLCECLGLRVRHLNFDVGVVTVHDNKGEKERTLPLPRAIVPALHDHMPSLQELHRQDLEKAYAGVFWVNALEEQHRDEARDFLWQWLFPARQLTREEGSGAMRRYHLHASHVQKAIRKAVEQAGISKRVTAYTFRHSFASHLLQNHYDIGTIQELLGHGNLRTTMIYTHTVKSVTRKEAQSPLDF